MFGEGDDERDGDHAAMVIGRDLPLSGRIVSVGHKDTTPRGISHNSDLQRLVIYRHVERWDEEEKDHPNRNSRIDLRRYDVRLSSFSRSSWPSGLPSPESLARAGFYYVGMEDRVICFHCNVQCEEWENDDEPLTRHFQANPECTFLSQDFPTQLQTLKQEASLQQYSNTSLRLHSFDNWPLSSVVTSYQLASVGFYYTGEGSKVICFSCGLEIKEWKRGDVPLLIHCRSNPNCHFIRSIVKGPSHPAPVQVLKTATDSTSRPNYSDLQVRIQSFKKLSPAFPLPRLKLAEAGLFLLRLPDVMKCYSCQTVLQGWVEGDVAIEKHRHASPHCPFLAKTFPSKLSSPSAVDPSTLPAAEFDERELEEMASHQSSNSSASALSLAGLTLSDPHTTTTSSQHLSVPSHQPCPSSIPDYKSMPHSPLYSSALKPHPHHSSSSSTSSIAVGGKSVSLPPSYSKPSTSRDPSQAASGGAECVVCMDRPLEMVFVPCGHICVCEECSTQITRCPICRTRTQLSVKVYFPY